VELRVNLTSGVWIRIKSSDKGPAKYMADELKDICTFW
jgi:hypothetical protein